MSNLTETDVDMRDARCGSCEGELASQSPPEASWWLGRLRVLLPICLKPHITDVLLMCCTSSR